MILNYFTHLTNLKHFGSSTYSHVHNQPHDTYGQHEACDFCQALSSLGMELNFTLNFGNSFNFSLDTRKKFKTTEFVKKKLSPSSVRRNTRRKESCLEKKGETFNSSEGSSLVDNSTKEVCPLLTQSYIMISGT